MTTISNKVRYYDSTMSGAPALSGAAGALIAVLDACLVDGWDSKVINSITITDGIAVALISSGHTYAEGDVIRVAGATPAALNSDWRLASVTADTVVWSVVGCGIADGSASGTMTALRAPAGWQKVFSASGRAAYRSLNYADHNGLILYVDDTGTTTARVRGYESMSDIDTGVGPFPNDAQLSGGYWWAKAHDTTGARPWRIAADDRRFAFCPQYRSVTSSAGSAPSYGFGRLLHAAPYDIWPTLISGASSSTNALSSTVANTTGKGLNIYDTTSAGDAGYLARSANGAVQSVSCTRTLRAHVAATGSTAYADAQLTDYLPAGEALIAEGATTAIVPRGLQAGAMHLCRRIASEGVAPAGTRIGSPGNGAVVVWANNGANAWLLSVGTNGSWE